MLEAAEPAGEPIPAPWAAAGGPASEPEAGATRVREWDGAEMVYLPAGHFLMGAADDDAEAEADERPQHWAWLDGFWIDRTEVTNGQYRLFVEAGGYVTREFWTRDGWAWV